MRSFPAIKKDGDCAKSSAMRILIVFVVVGSWGCLLTGCSLLWKGTSTKSLGEWTPSERQMLTMRKEHGIGTVQKIIPPNVRALLVTLDDTLLVEPIIATLPSNDNDPQTLDKSDSALTFFAHNYFGDAPTRGKEDAFRVWDSHFDADAITIPFKYRFRQGTTLPGGFVSNANVGLYAGWRVDVVTHSIMYTQNTCLSELTSVAYGFGVFSTVNPVTVNPWNTDYRLDVEYDGLGVNYGIAAIAAYQQMTVGLLLGFEVLLDENARYWVFHNKPWIGILLGVNLN